MDNNSVDKHICNNAHARAERNYQPRMEPERERLMEPLTRNEVHGYYGSHENKCKNEHGGEVFVSNMGKMTYRNINFRESVWTGKYLQMTVMSIQRGDDIGIEMHHDTDQFIRIEHGTALAVIGKDDACERTRYKLCAGDAIFIPAGTWHNIINIGRCDLKISSIYAPPHHPRCTSEYTK